MATKAQIHFGHANGFPGECYQRFLDPLRLHASVYAPSLLAHDSRFPVNAGWTNIADEIADSVRTNCLPGAIGIGHSMGGLCSLIAAHRHPGLFSALILLDPPALIGWPGLMMGMAKATGQIDKVTPAGRSKHRRDTWPSREAMAENLRGKALFKGFHPDCFDAYIEHGSEPFEGGVRLRFTVENEVAIFRNGPWHLRNCRSPLGIPGAIVTGNRSEFLRLGTHAKLAKQQGFEYAQAEGGHMFPLENPESSAQQIIALLQKWQLV